MIIFDSSCSRNVCVNIGARAESSKSNKIVSDEKNKCIQNESSDERAVIYRRVLCTGVKWCFYVFTLVTHGARTAAALRQQSARNAHDVMVNNSMVVTCFYFTSLLLLLELRKKENHAKIVAGFLIAMKCNNIM